MINSNSNTISALVNLLQQHSKIHILSAAVTAAAVVIFILSAVLLKQPTVIIALTLVIIVAGFYETYLAIRIGFDTKLFKRLDKPNINLEHELELIDTALLALKLIPNGNTRRNLNTRMQGVKNLFKKQVIICLLQISVVLVIGYYYSVFNE